MSRSECDLRHAARNAMCPTHALVAYSGIPLIIAAGSPMPIILHEGVQERRNSRGEARSRVYLVECRKRFRPPWQRYHESITFLRRTIHTLATAHWVLRSTRIAPTWLLAWNRCPAGVVKTTPSPVKPRPEVSGTISAAVVRGVGWTIKIVYCTTAR